MIPRTRRILSVALVIVGVALAFLYGQIDVANKSVQFDLRIIGQSVYEAHSKTGKWPMQIADLEGTEYLKMPHRRTMLEYGAFVVVWQQDLDPSPVVNRDRVLAYHNKGLLSQFGKVWACRGDLRIERMDSAQAQAPIAK